MPSPIPVRHPLAQVVATPTSQPKYLFKRGQSFYFKRKIPTDVADAFPEFRCGGRLSARRRVPIHSELVRLGLLTYVEAMRKRKQVFAATCTSS